jgi:hypothetical protein
VNHARAIATDRRDGEVLLHFVARGQRLFACVVMGGRRAARRSESKFIRFA